MITRREAVRIFGSTAAAAWMLPALIASRNDTAIATPPLLPGAPTSPERTALIEQFQKRSEGLDKKYEARTHKGDWEMPYRLFRPQAKGKLPLVA